jgi:hypothetical protein
MVSKLDKNSVRQLWTNLSADGYIASDKISTSIQRCLIWLFHMLLDGSTIDRISELSYILPTRITTDDFHKLKVSLGNLLNLEGDRLGKKTCF